MYNYYSPANCNSYLFVILQLGQTTNDGWHQIRNTQPTLAHIPYTLCLYFPIHRWSGSHLRGLEGFTETQHLAVLPFRSVYLGTPLRVISSCLSATSLSLFSTTYSNAALRVRLSAPRPVYWQIHRCRLDKSDGLCTTYRLVAIFPRALL